jgi:hypothetical protein
MQRMCDLCDNPPTYKCDGCRDEMHEPVKNVDPWWPRVAMGRSIVVANDQVAAPPPDFMYV